MVVARREASTTRWPKKKNGTYSSAGVEQQQASITLAVAWKCADLVATSGRPPSLAQPGRGGPPKQTGWHIAPCSLHCNKHTSTTTPHTLAQHSLTCNNKEEKKSFLFLFHRCTHHTVAVYKCVHVQLCIFGNAREQLYDSVEAHQLQLQLLLLLAE